MEGVLNSYFLSLESGLYSKKILDVFFNSNYKKKENSFQGVLIAKILPRALCNLKCIFTKNLRTIVLIGGFY